MAGGEGEDGAVGGQQAGASTGPAAAAGGAPADEDEEDGAEEDDANEDEDEDEDEHEGKNADADEDLTTVQLAWEVLEVARVIFTKFVVICLWCRFFTFANSFGIGR